MAIVNAPNSLGQVLASVENNGSVTLDENAIKEALDKEVSAAKGEKMQPKKKERKLERTSLSESDIQKVLERIREMERRVAEKDKEIARLKKSPRRTMRTTSSSTRVSEMMQTEKPKLDFIQQHGANILRKKGRAESTKNGILGMKDWTTKSIQCCKSLTTNCNKKSQQAYQTSSKKFSELFRDVFPEGMEVSVDNVDNLVRYCLEQQNLYIPQVLGFFHLDFNKNQDSACRDAEVLGSNIDEMEEEGEEVETEEWKYNGTTYYVDPSTQEVMTEEGEVVGIRKKKFMGKGRGVEWIIVPVE